MFFFRQAEIHRKRSLIESYAAIAPDFFRILHSSRLIRLPEKPAVPAYLFSKHEVSERSNFRTVAQASMLNWHFSLYESYATSGEECVVYRCSEECGLA